MLRPRIPRSFGFSLDRVPYLGLRVTLDGVLARTEILWIISERQSLRFGLANAGDRLVSEGRLKTRPLYIKLV